MTKLPDDVMGQLADHIRLGNIRAQIHPYLPLEIYNYTPQVQYSRTWDDVTRMARGLILDITTGEIVARPFPKFFNWGEWDEDKQAQYTARPHHVYEKVDGSLGILYHWDGEWMLATRGSFGSEQAVMGTKLLQNYNLSQIPTEGVTPLVEIVYPQNRIVVDYGDRTELVFLAALSIPTGVRLPSPWWTGPRAKLIPRNLDTIDLAVPWDETEGFVIVFNDGEMVKIKFPEYVRLHRILTGTNAVRVWEALQDHDLWVALINRVPDEFLDWLKEVELDLRSKYLHINHTAKVLYDEHEHLASISRRAFAEWATTTKYPDILFKMLDDKDYAPNIWKRIKPEATRPFREET